MNLLIDNNCPRHLNAGDFFIPHHSLMGGQKMHQHFKLKQYCILLLFSTANVILPPMIIGFLAAVKRPLPHQWNAANSVVKQKKAPRIVVLFKKNIMNGCTLKTVVPSMLYFLHLTFSLVCNEQQ